MAMNQFKGTKGKWANYRSTLVNNEIITHSVSCQTKRIALCYNFWEEDQTKNVDQDEAKYNALLISKAPKMLETLDQIIPMLKSLEGYEETIKEIEKLIKEATDL